jgi:hypothetical protein
MAKKMTMKQFEKSAVDRRADKAGRHGPEGSKRDIAADKRALAKMNKGRR